jgi:hypothetical protein
MNLKLSNPEPILTERFPFPILHSFQIFIPETYVFTVYPEQPEPGQAASPEFSKTFLFSLASVARHRPTISGTMTGQAAL